MWRLLDPNITHEEIAERWAPESVTHQSVSKHLARAGWNDIHHVTLRSYENVAKSAMAFADLLKATEPLERW